jgi:hypothetical protein
LLLTDTSVSSLAESRNGWQGITIDLGTLIYLIATKNRSTAAPV